MSRDAQGADERLGVGIERILDSPCFITGHTRSGTNLLNRLLHGHPAVLCAPGEGKTHALRKLAYVDWARMAGDEALAQLREILEYNLATAPAERLFAAIAERLPVASTYRGVLVAVLGGIAAEQDADARTLRLWTEKNHNLEFYFHHALRAFSHPRMIYIMRDPRDNWASWRAFCDKHGLRNDLGQFSVNMQTHMLEECEALESGYGRFQTIEQLAEEYCIKPDQLLALRADFLRAGRRQAVLQRPYFDPGNFPGADAREGRFAWNWRMMGLKAAHNQRTYPGRFLVIRYEDIVMHPTATMKAVAAFLGVQYSDALVNPTQVDGRWTGNSSFVDAMSGLDSSSLGAHATRLSRAESANILAVAGELMASHGY